MKDKINIELTIEADAGICNAAWNTIDPKDRDFDILTFLRTIYGHDLNNLKRTTLMAAERNHDIRGAYGIDQNYIKMDISNALNIKVSVPYPLI